MAGKKDQDIVGKVIVGVSSALATALILWVFRVFALPLEESERIAIARELVNNADFSDVLLKKMAEKGTFRGEKGGPGPQGIPGLIGPPGLGAPIGAVVAYPVSDGIPGGWLVCDGAMYNPAEYQELFQVLGTRYGGNGTTEFQVPDYRGYFFRGLDATGTIDPEGTNRIVGSIQKDSFEKHSHRLLNNKGEEFVYGTREGDNGHNVRFSTGVDRDPAEITFEATGGSETRPKNVAVVRIIRAK